MTRAAKAKPGLVLIYTGPGKGKTTAALGSALRALGHGLRVLMIQFIKSPRGQGELEAAGHLPGLSIRPLGLGLIRPGDDPAPHRAAARQAWEMAREELASGAWEMLILDEVFAALSRGFIAPREMKDLLAARTPEMHLVLTGRDCPGEFMALADMVTEMEAIKHHLKAGRLAQEGIEF